MRSRVVTALLLSLSLFLPACAGGTPSAENESQETSGGAATREAESTNQWTTVQAVNPEDILSEEERTGAPKYKDFFEEGSDEPVQLSSGTSAGAIPAVKPFNFGRDPSGPEDKTLYLSIPKLGVQEVPVFDSVSEEKLAEGTIHVPATGFPWQDGANVYIAGHRLGYPETRSLYVFYDLDKLVAGDEIVLKDAAGEEYYYRLTEQKVVPPDNVEVMNAVKDKSLVTLQTCTLPDFTERVIVQGKLIKERTG
jgi:sortase A